MRCTERSRSYKMQFAEGLHHNLPAFLAYSDNSFPLDIGITPARKELAPIGRQRLADGGHRFADGDASRKTPPVVAH